MKKKGLWEEEEGKKSRLGFNNAMSAVWETHICMCVFRLQAGFTFSSFCESRFITKCLSRRRQNNKNHPRPRFSKSWFPCCFEALLNIRGMNIINMCDRLKYPITVLYLQSEVGCDFWIAVPSNKVGRPRRPFGFRSPTIWPVLRRCMRIVSLEERRPPQFAPLGLWRKSPCAFTLIPWPLSFGVFLLRATE